jgi:hypothetical protein
MASHELGVGMGFFLYFPFLIFAFLIVDIATERWGIFLCGKRGLPISSGEY